jgi:deoxyribonuclease-4
LRIGAHLTISKGLPEAARLARRLGADTFGFHTRNPRGGASRAITAEELEAWRREQAEDGGPLGPLVGHLPYVINLGSDRDIWEFGVRVVAEDLVRCAAFGAYAIVLHPGHCAPEALDRGIARVAEGVAAALERAGPARCLLCLEAMAGQRGEIGGRPEELAAILQALDWPDGVGVCLDTCHLFAAGWDIRTHAGIDRMLEAFDAAVGLGRVRVLHLNDSKFPLGSRRDRHERLGRGEIGRDGLAAVLTHPVLRELPIIIETPVDDYAVYAEEIAVARELAGEALPGVPSAAERPPGTEGRAAPPRRSRP